MLLIEPRKYNILFFGRYICVFKSVNKLFSHITRLTLEAETTILNNTQKTQIYPKIQQHNTSENTDGKQQRNQLCICGYVCSKLTH